MSSYTTVFGGQTILPTYSEFSSYTLSADIALSWPSELTAGDNVVSQIVEVNPTVANRVITLPSALLVSPGQAIVFSNIGASNFFVVDAGNGALVTVTPGTIWTVYLRDNTTVAGLWRSFQNGAGTSVANAAGLAGLGIKAIGSTLNQSAPVTNFNSNYTTGSSDRASTRQWTGGAGTLTFPLANSIGNDWFLLVRNSGSGNLTLTPTGADLIDGAATVAIGTGESCIVVCDGTGYFTIGRGRQISSTFNVLNISLTATGSGTYTLSSAELAQVGYKFTGVLTGNINIVVPNTIAQYWVDNSTTGAFTLTVKTAAGSGVAVPQGQRYILYADGTNVVNADTASIPTPVSIANGGTNATTAAGARTNLGATSTGDALFTAASASAARATLDVLQTVDSLNYAVAL